MGRDLYAEEPVFAAAIDRCAALLAPLRKEPLTAVLFDDDSPIDETRWTQPALFALGYALAELWASLGAAARGRRAQRRRLRGRGRRRRARARRRAAPRRRLRRADGWAPAGGAMASVAADERRVLAASAALVGSSRRSTRLTRSSSRATPTRSTPRSPRSRATDHRPPARRQPRLPQPAHGADRRRVLRRAAACAMRAPTLRFIDDCTGAARGRAPTADDWAAHLRAPVRFADALRALAGRGLRRARRARPRPALLAFARCTLGADCPPTLPSLRPGRPVFAESLPRCGASARRSTGRRASAGAGSRGVAADLPVSAAAAVVRGGRGGRGG
ncbi:MAG: acyltransferase domain-containing protein [Myxococcales bacterium]|nr:acyltransferase domain-containing protein [Myxococcales bacterium]